MSKIRKIEAKVKVNWQSSLVRGILTGNAEGGAVRQVSGKMNFCQKHLIF
jgi:hypothetical protein